MLHKFLEEHKSDIIQLCRKKVAADDGSKATSELLEQGLPIFFGELIGVLRRTATTGQKDAVSKSVIEPGNAAAHGKESLRLGYTISQVVHSYGAVCQSVTEYAQTKSYNITTREFQDLNLSLDCAIAEAVTQFEKDQSKNVSDTEVERLGFLMHEMRNSLSAASAAYQMVQKGSVGIAGVTSDVLSRSHARMQRLIESAEVEIRLRGHTKLRPAQIHLIDIIRDVNADVALTASSQDVHLESNVDPLLQITVDRHLIFSALLNLVGNAVKYSKKHGNVSIRAKESAGRILIEVEDECGGLQEEKIEELFKPFVQKGADKTGMGLGLSLSRTAVELNQGTLKARNILNKGCVLTIDLPK